MSTIAPAQPMSPAPLAGTPVQALAPSELYRFTIDQYERMGEAGILTEDDRVELIDGYVVTKMGKGPAHFWVVESVEGALKILLGGGWCVRREGTARMPPSDEPEPDVVVAGGPAPPTSSAIRTRPTSCSSSRSPIRPTIAIAARSGNANARSGIPVYWIVNLPRRRVEVYTDPTPEGYRSRRDYHAGEAIPVVIDGQLIGHVAVNDILPPPPAVPAAEGNGA